MKRRRRNLQGIGDDYFRPTRVRVHGGDESYASIAKVGLDSGKMIYEGFVVVRVGRTLET